MLSPLHGVSQHDQGATLASAVERERASPAGSRKRQRSISPGDGERAKRTRNSGCREEDSEDSEVDDDRSQALIAYERGCELFQEYNKARPRDKSVLNEAIALLETSLEERPSDDFFTCKAQHQLSEALCDRWRWHGGDVTDLYRSIELYYAALTNWPPDQLKDIIGTNFLCHYWVEEKTFRQAFEHYRTGLDRIPLDHFNRPSLLGSLALVQFLLLEQEGAFNSTGSIGLRTAVLHNLPFDHPDRLWLEYFLAQTLSSIWDYYAAPVTMCEAALDNMPQDHPDRMWVQICLAWNLPLNDPTLSQFVRSQELYVLKNRPENHRARTLFKGTLEHYQDLLITAVGDRVDDDDYDDDDDDDDDAIELITTVLQSLGARRRPGRQWILASKHLSRWQKTQDPADLSRSIELLEASLRENPSDPNAKFFLASALRKRGTIHHDTNDFDHSIELFENLEEFDESLYFRRESRVKLGLALAIARRWSLKRDATDLDYFIQFYTTGINPFRPDPKYFDYWLDDGTGHTDCIELLVTVLDTVLENNLCDPKQNRIDVAQLLKQRWERLKNPTDLDRSIKTFEEALGNDLANSTKFLPDFASAVIKRWELRHEVADLDRWVDIEVASLDQTVTKSFVLLRTRELVEYVFDQLCARPSHFSNSNLPKRSMDLFISLLTKDGRSIQGYEKETAQKIIFAYIEVYDSLDELDIPLAVLQAVRPGEHQHLLPMDLSILRGLLDRYSLSQHLPHLNEVVNFASTLFLPIRVDSPKLLAALSLVGRTVGYLVDQYDRSGRLRFLEQATPLVQECFAKLPEYHPQCSTLSPGIAEFQLRCLPVLTVRQKGIIAADKGGFSYVYRGWLHNTLVAMKTPRWEVNQDAQQRIKWFMKEIYLWYRVNHHHILKVLGMHLENDKIYVVSPWCANGNCLSYVESHRGLDVIIRLLCQVAEALQYLHAFSPPVVHGDIKAENVLIDDNGDALLCDFGLSRIEVPDMSGLTRTMTELAGAGTIRFMAPELHPGEDNEEEDVNGVRSWSKTTKSDVYAFGCLIFQLVTGNKPFHNIRADHRVIAKVIDGHRPDRPPTFDNDDLWSLCTECWTHDRESRPPINSVLGRLRGIQLRATASLASPL